MTGGRGHSAFKLILRGVFLVCMAVSACMGGFYLYQYAQNASEQKSLVSEYVSDGGAPDLSVFEAPDGVSLPDAPHELPAVMDALEGLELLKVDHDGLYAKNPDYVGWVDIPGLGISYPVFKSLDNQKYLHHNSEGKYSYAGSIFLDMDCSADSKNLVLHGHNMKNGSMFHPLNRYLGGDAQKYPLAVFYGRDGKAGIFTVYAAFQENGGRMEDVEVGSFPTKDAYDIYTSECLAKSTIEGFGAPKPMDRLLTLCTCRGRSEDDLRCVVCFRLVLELAPEA